MSKIPEDYIEIMKDNGYTKKEIIEAVNNVFNEE